MVPLIVPFSDQNIKQLLEPRQVKEPYDEEPIDKFLRANGIPIPRVDDIPEKMIEDLYGKIVSFTCKVKN